MQFHLIVALAGACSAQGRLPEQLKDALIKRDVSVFTNHALIASVPAPLVFETIAPVTVIVATSSECASLNASSAVPSTLTVTPTVTVLTTTTCDCNSSTAAAANFASSSVAAIGSASYSESTVIVQITNTHVATASETSSAVLTALASEATAGSASSSEPTVFVEITNTHVVTVSEPISATLTSLSTLGSPLTNTAPSNEPMSTAIIQTESSMADASISYTSTVTLAQTITHTQTRTTSRPSSTVQLVEGTNSSEVAPVITSVGMSAYSVPSATTMLAVNSTEGSPITASSSLSVVNPTPFAMSSQAINSTEGSPVFDSASQPMIVPMAGSDSTLGVSTVTDKPASATTSAFAIFTGAAAYSSSGNVNFAMAAVAVLGLVL